MSLEDAIDQLYRGPLSDFTTARNALARERKGDRGSILALRKPNVPAWGVNQLFWRDRRAYDRLVRAAERLRAAHGAAAPRPAAEMRELEAAHNLAIKAAADRVRDILKVAGLSHSPSIMQDVRSTLEAMPDQGPPGRLVQPLQPIGFEKLARLIGMPREGRPADIVSIDSGRAKRAANTTHITAAARRRDLARAQSVLDAARKDVKTKQRAHETTARHVERMIRVRDELDRRRDQLSEAITQQKARRDAARRAVDQAEVARAAAERALTALRARKE
jgi:hypothetical protein